MEWHYGSTHFQKVVRSGPSDRAVGREMVDLINGYFANRSLDSGDAASSPNNASSPTAARRKVAAEIVGQLSFPGA
jgi:hypothetical protein